MGQALLHNHIRSIGIDSMHITKYSRHPRRCPSSPTDAARACKEGEAVECSSSEEANQVAQAMRKDGWEVVRRTDIQVWKVLNDLTNSKAPSLRRSFSQS